MADIRSARYQQPERTLRMLLEGIVVEKVSGGCEPPMLQVPNLIEYLHHLILKQNIINPRTPNPNFAKLKSKIISYYKLIEMKKESKLEEVDRLIT